MNNLALSVVVPCYNSESSIVETLTHIFRAIELAELAEWEVLVVDDGSQDSTAQVIGELGHEGLRLIRQSNQGRLQARLNGLQEAQHDLCLLVDSRVHISVGSLRYVLGQEFDTSSIAISAPCEFPKETSLLGLFWDSISRLIWRKFRAKPERVRLTPENFGSIPKGTTCILISKSEMISASIDARSESNLHQSFLNDDTAIFKKLVNDSDFHFVVDPNFLAVYYPRTSFRRFLHHAMGRGRVLIHGLYPKISKFQIQVLTFLVLTSISLIMVFAALSPLKFFVFTLCLAIILTVTALTMRLPTRNVASLIVFGIPFIFAYMCGVLQSILGSIKTK